MKNIGKYLYIAPIAIFGLMHLAMGSKMNMLVPSWLPFPTVWVYLTGLSLIAAAVALIMNKKAKLAMTLLAVELIAFVVLIHIPTLVGGDQNAMGMVLKDLSMAGAALFIGGTYND